MIILNLDRNSQIPLFRQVIDQLKEKIDDETIKPGEVLPPTRVFSSQLGVNRTTIYKAYQELWALGYIESRSGSYSRVRQRRDIMPAGKERESAAMNWAAVVNPSAEKVFRMFGHINYPFSEVESGFNGIDFGQLHPDMRLFPVDEFRKSFDKVIQQQGSSVLDYGDTKGLPALRQYIAGRMRSHSISASEPEILITNGAQNAIDLLMKLLARPGSRVFVESPTYGMIFPTLTYYNCEIVSIPMNNDGVDLEILERELQKGLPIFFYTMPNFHNPTGITTNQEHRERLIALFEKYNVPIIEDAFEEEMKYLGKVSLPIKSMDLHQIVIYLGSFSKILFPGIRLGWIVADKVCIDRLAALKRFDDICTSQPDQAALADFCHKGYYELHVKRIHKIYRKRMQIATQALKSYITNDNIEWKEPNGGFTIWLELKNTNLGYEEINSILLAHNVRVALGKDFFPVPNAKKYFRLAIANLNEKEIETGVRQLADAINEIYNKNN
ncbi:MAG: PLP-dependent aminotransferase family protein [Ignavibacteria bacterium]|nr:PLP-dependent aminotransferase family protein [Ignavibacteria bacterium]